MSEAASQNQRAALEPTRLNVADARRWVIKIGSAVLTDNGQGLSETFIAQLAQDVVSLRERGCEVILVSSGAVAAGLARLGISEPPSALDELQAAAAVGQASLVHAYQAAFAPAGQRALAARSRTTGCSCERWY